MQTIFAPQGKTDITTIKQNYNIETIDKCIMVDSTIFEAMKKANELFPDINILVVIKDPKGNIITRRTRKDADPKLVPGFEPSSENEVFPYPNWTPFNI